MSATSPKCQIGDHDQCPVVSKSGVRCACYCHQPKPVRDLVTATISVQDTEARIGETFEHPQHGLLTVVDVTRRYIPQDGWSFGLMAESGYLYTRQCRPATDAERTTYETAEAELQARKQEHEQNEIIAAQCREQGTEIAFEDVPAGEYTKIETSSDGFINRYLVKVADATYYVDVYGTIKRAWALKN